MDCAYARCRLFLFLVGEFRNLRLQGFFLGQKDFFSLSASLKLGAGTKIFGFCYFLSGQLAR